MFYFKDIPLNIFKIILFLFYKFCIAQVDYHSSIQPIFNNHCLNCHQYPIRAGALELDTYENLMLGESNNGPVVIPFNPDSSILYRVLLRDSVIVPNEPICCRMPKDAPPLSQNTIDLIYNWIEEGAEEEVLKIKQKRNIIENIKLIKNYSNPFNSTTTFIYQVLESSNIYIGLFDLLGNEIIILLDNEKKPGVYKINWNGKNNNGSLISPGIYFYRFVSNNFDITKKLIFLK